MAEGQRPVFETWEGKDGKFYAHFQAGNSQIVWSTEGYESPDAASHAIELLIDCVKGDDYDVTERGVWVEPEPADASQETEEGQQGNDYPPNLTDPWDDPLAAPEGTQEPEHG